MEDLQSDELSNSEDEESEDEDGMITARERKGQDEEDCDDTLRQEDNSEDDSEDELMTSKNSKRFGGDLPRKLASLNNPSKMAAMSSEPSAQLSKVMHWSESESEGQDGDIGHKANSDSYNSSESQATPNGENIDYGDDEEWGEPETPVKQLTAIIPGKSVITKTKGKHFIHYVFKVFGACTYSIPAISVTQSRDARIVKFAG